MFDIDRYQKRLMAGVEFAKAQRKVKDDEHDELKKRYDELEKEVKAIIAPLNGIKNLLPSSVKNFLNKHKGD